MGASQCKSSMNYLWILLDMTHDARNEFSAERNRFSSDEGQNVLKTVRLWLEQAGCRQHQETNISSFQHLNRDGILCCLRGENDDSKATFSRPEDIHLSLDRPFFLLQTDQRRRRRRLTSQRLSEPLKAAPHGPASLLAHSIRAT